MKKMLYFLSFAIVLSLTACSEQVQAPDIVFQSPVKDVNWGMSPVEVIEILELSEEGIQNNNGGIVVLKCEDLDIFGQSADVEMMFDTQAQMGLMHMWIYFHDVSKESLVETLNNAYGDCSMIDSEGVPCQWKSEKIEDMSEEIQERFQQILVFPTAWDNEQSGFSGETIWNAKKTQSLVTVTLSDNILNYNATYMAGYLVLSDDNAYEELLNYLNSNDDTWR